MRKIKTKFALVAREHAGRILIHSYAGKCLTFTPLATPLQSGIKCDCGSSEWNATNFGNPIHFCPSKVYTFEITPFQAIEIGH